MTNYTIEPVLYRGSEPELRFFRPGWEAPGHRDPYLLTGSQVREAVREAASVVDSTPHITAVCVDGSRDLLRRAYLFHQQVESSK